MQHMRLISEAYEEICGTDPNTAITKNAFRRLVLSGQIPSVQIGRKRLVALEEVNRFFLTDNKMENDVFETGKICAVKECER